MTSLPTPKTVSFCPLGPIQLLGQRYSGRFFDIYEVERDGRRYDLKTPTSHTSPPSQQSTDSVYTSRATGIETSLWGGDTQQGINALNDAPWGLDLLLQLEAEKIRQTAGAWNHQVTAIGVWDGPENNWKLQELMSHHRFRTAMLMPHHPGHSLEELSQRQQRVIWPRMMSAMWRALLRMGHGDLSLSNLILAPDGGRFVLIDPGVALWSTANGETNPMFMDHGVLLTCNARYYPLLPPTYTPPRPLQNAARLEHHMMWLAFLSRETTLGPVIGSANFLPQRAELPPRTFDALFADTFRRFQPEDSNQGGATPPPADMLALGILYYEILTGQHPFTNTETLQRPLWTGAFGEGHRKEIAQRYTDFVDWWEKEEYLKPLHECDAAPAEKALAKALLSLKVPFFGALVHLVQEACAQTSALAEGVSFGVG